MNSIATSNRRQSRSWGAPSSTLAGLLFAVLLSTPPDLKADWVNLTGAETAQNIAEIYILDDHVKLVLEVAVDAVEKFEGLVPDDWIKDGSVTSNWLRQRPPGLPVAARSRQFSQEIFRFVTESGEALEARFEVVEPRLRKDRQSSFAGVINPFTRQRLRGPPQDRRVVYAEVVYPFKERPRELTMSPPLDDKKRPVVTVGFIAYHKSVPVIDFRYLSGQCRIELEWADPWNSKFDDPNLWRHHKSALMSFLYIEPFEVRHEILTRVKDLESWMDLGLRGDQYIEIDELDPLKRRIGEFLRTKNPVLLDGTPTEPVLDRANYVKVGLTGIQVLEVPERLEISTAIVGLVLAHITADIPQEVKVEWELFTDQIQRVPATSIDPAGPLPAMITPDNPVHTWTNRLKNYRAPTVEHVAVDKRLTTIELPIGSALCLLALVPVAWQILTRRKTARSTRAPITALVFLVGGALTLYPFARVTIAKPASLAPGLSEDDAKEILQSLLKNIYRAFDFREEEDVYDKLALTVDGDLLSDIYLKSRKSLEVEKAGGAQARVKEIEILEAKMESRTNDALSYTIKGKWTALGTVGHWGHVHVRKNSYSALVTIAGVEGSWKIAGMEILDEARIDPTASGATPRSMASSQDSDKSAKAERNR